LGLLIDLIIYIEIINHIEVLGGYARQVAMAPTTYNSISPCIMVNMNEIEQYNANQVTAAVKALHIQSFKE
jgi:hypothetical protein